DSLTNALLTASPVVALASPSANLERSRVHVCRHGNGSTAPKRGQSQLALLWRVPARLPFFDSLWRTAACLAGGRFSASTLRRSASIRLTTRAGSRRSGNSIGLPDCFWRISSFNAVSY